jgi:endonuclease I
MKKIVCCLLLIPFFLIAQIPAYYSSVDFTATGDELKNQLSQLITITHTTFLPYTSNQTDTWDAIKLSDLDPINSNNVLLIYGWDDMDQTYINDRTRNKNLTCNSLPCDGLWNREHVYPRSLGTPNLGFEFAGSDVHNLRSVDNIINETRGNRAFDFGFGTNSYITFNGYWYPGDEWKGDVARMIMYMYVRYPTQCLATNVGIGPTNYSNFGDMPNIFLEWNWEDPVSQYEINRNNVLQNLQGNRNPFIDNPYLATLIWNGPVAVDNWGTLSVPTPTTDSIIIYPTITYDYINITNQQNKKFEYAIYNYLGQLINLGITTNRIDFSNNTSGIYFVKLDSDNYSKTHKIIRK